VKNRWCRTGSKYGRFLVILVFMMMLQACASQKHTMPPLASVEGVQRHFSQGRIIDLKTGEAIDFEDLIDNLGAADVIFVGEVHNNPEHHLLQVQLLQALGERYAPPLAVAMEFFDRTRQPVLDRFMNGELGEKDFLEQVDWEKGWRFPYRLYRPLLFTTRDKGTTLLGINAPSPVVKKVARTGLESLTADERNQVAREMDLHNADHREHMETIFKEHAFHKTAPGHMENFEHFYQAQCVWDETMAETIADYMAAEGGKMVVFTGNGHIANRFGIPERVLRRTNLQTATIVLYPLTERTTINKRLADYVWLTSDCKTRSTMRRPRKMPPIKTDTKRKDLKR
jgi:uncharacterized iron-regulated protein